MGNVFGYWGMKRQEWELKKREKREEKSKLVDRSRQQRVTATPPRAAQRDWREKKWKYVSRQVGMKKYACLLLPPCSNVGIFPGCCSLPHSLSLSLPTRSFFSLTWCAATAKRKKCNNYHTSQLSPVRWCSSAAANFDLPTKSSLQSTNSPTMSEWLYAAIEIFNTIKKNQVLINIRWQHFITLLTCLLPCWRWYISHVCLFVIIFCHYTHKRADWTLSYVAGGNKCHIFYCTLIRVCWVSEWVANDVRLDRPINQPTNITHNIIS